MVVVSSSLDGCLEPLSRQHSREQGDGNAIYPWDDLFLAGAPETDELHTCAYLTLPSLSKEQSKIANDTLGLVNHIINPAFMRMYTQFTCRSPL